jgi:PhzF family phenazine biosynthesis protein
MEKPAAVRLPLYVVDAFTTRRFAGNPAAVVVLDAFLDDAVLQAIAAENNLSETAFLVRDGDDYRLRWFTPLVEVPLCGHGTLASAAVVMERLERDRRRIVFHTLSGPLTVARTPDGYAMDFPARAFAPVATPPGLAQALGVEPLQVWTSATNYMALLENARAVRDLAPDLAAVARLDRTGVVVTAAGDAGYDCVSRYFAPAKGVPEDPVTGGAHCALAPYWAQRLGKSELRAYQASRRGGEITCRIRGDRVELEGSCVFYLAGHIEA